MNFRIDRLHDRSNQVVLRMSGRIEAQALVTLRDLLEREKGKVAVDLKEVSLVAREAVAFFALCKNRGIELRHCPAYVQEWIDQEASPG